MTISNNFHGTVSRITQLSGRRECESRDRRLSLTASESHAAGCAVNYITEAARKIAAEGPLMVREDVHDAYNKRVDAENAKMAWGQQGFTSWYKNAQGRVSQNWPFALVDYWQATRQPASADLEPAPGSTQSA